MLSDLSRFLVKWELYEFSAKSLSLMCFNTFIFILHLQCDDASCTHCSGDAEMMYCAALTSVCLSSIWQTMKQWSCIYCWVIYLSLSTWQLKHLQWSLLHMALFYVNYYHKHNLILWKTLPFIDQRLWICITDKQCNLSDSCSKLTDNKTPFSDYLCFNWILKPVGSCTWLYVKVNQTKNKTQTPGSKQVVCGLNWWHANKMLL